MLRFSQLFLIVSTLLIRCHVTCLAQEANTVSVLLEDGRTTTGWFSTHTDDTHLWIRGAEAGIEMHSGFPWPAIQRLTRDGVSIGAADLRAELAQLPRPTEVIPKLQVAAASSPPRQQRRPRLTVQPIRSLRIQCALGNWDADANVDGLLITIWPLNDQLTLEPATGELDLVLYAEREEITFPSQNPRQLPELARISHRMLQRDFANGPAAYRLPFADHDPESDASVSRYGIVHARLGVSGQGGWETTDSSVRLRNSSTLRDRLQHATGQRYFSFENPNP